MIDVSCIIIPVVAIKKFFSSFFRSNHGRDAGKTLIIVKLLRGKAYQEFALCGIKETYVQIQ